MGNYVLYLGKAIAPFYACRKTGENTKSSHSNVQASYWPALKSVNNSSSITTQPISSQSEDFRTVYTVQYTVQLAGSVPHYSMLGCFCVLSHRLGASESTDLCLRLLVNYI